MDDNLYQAQCNNLFTDLLLILKDSNETVELNVHKIILWSRSSYFNKLLQTNTYKESLLSNITIEVPNANVTRDIILSFYNFNKSDTKIAD